MANKRPKPEEIVSKLHQVEVLMGQGMSRLDAIRQIGVVEQTYYRWRKQYGGMGVDQLKELKRLQKENDRLRRAVSDLTLDKFILTEAAISLKQMGCSRTPKIQDTDPTVCSTITLVGSKTSQKSWFPLQ